MDYSNFINVANAQIADKGRAVTIIYKSQGGYDPIRDSFKNQSETEQSATMVLTDYQRREIDGTLIKIGDRLGLLSPVNLQRRPTTGDRVRLSAEVYTGGVSDSYEPVDQTFSIESVQEIRPGEDIIMYKLQLRRGGGVNSGFSS